MYVWKGRHDFLEFVSTRSCWKMPGWGKCPKGRRKSHDVALPLHKSRKGWNAIAYEKVGTAQYGQWKMWVVFPKGFDCSDGRFLEGFCEKILKCCKINLMSWKGSLKSLYWITIWLSLSVATKTDTALYLLMYRFRNLTMVSLDGMHMSIVAIPCSLRYPKHWAAANNSGELGINSQARALKKNHQVNGFEWIKRTR